MCCLSMLALLAVLLVPTTVFLRRLFHPLLSTFTNSSTPPKSLSFSKIRAVPWYEYLPNGHVFSFMCDVRTCGTALAALCVKYGDTLQVWLGSTSTIVCGHPADVAHILASVSHFGRPEGMQYVLKTTVPNSLLVMPPKTHHITKTNIHHTFNYTMLKQFHTPMLEAISNITPLLFKRTDATPHGQFSTPVDITEILSMLTFRVITNVALGASLSVCESLQFARDVDTFLNGVFIEAIGYPFRTYFSPFASRRHLVDNRNKVARVCEAIIAKRMAESKNARSCRPYDVLDAILNMDDHSVETATSHVMVFTLAGAHTVAHSMSWLLFEALQQPHVIHHLTEEVDKVVADRAQYEALQYEDVSKLRYMRAVWKETLRMRPPAALHVRQAKEDVVLRGSGLTVRKGTQVAALLERSHKHDSVWKDAHIFSPERWGLAQGDRREGDCAPLGAFVPFSLGPANCVGQFFAEYEAMLVLAELLRRFEFRLACRPQEIMSSASWVNVGRYASKGDGRYNMGIPVKVRRR